ncbi:insulinase family protein [Exiguobacterium sp. SH3S2]|uniref:EF-P 5-aminopentanol modification-associated protein YfmF n=1 Tax=unclassified Exiguobacterium TaxID=2644629 RepID=UPI0008BE99CE|nr:MULTISPECIES: pitrilysin family protein [unclassified Exiguobacterium]OGX80360.1 peptidase M16 [Exiguobacterium sp. SH31]TCI25172.1 insulinase family protein [Exiguobacterium sp. SH5S4]TCI39717.1 insulinase family protein [Exiguobacterium sp. SH4S7]TCI46376.1 insulinase family protein [Exiguobacterium sp. SH3S3]TCI57103.1 insulinase family protein [Exiguobacterium sp. SH5S13]
MKGIEQFRNQLHYSVYPTDKFKTTTCLVSFAAPLSAETIADRALLPYVMEKATAAYPSIELFHTPLEQLYDASLFAGASKVGKEHVIQFQLEVVNDRLVGEPVLSQAIKLLEEVLLRPNVYDGAFQPLIVEQESRLQRQRIESVYDDKMRFAQQRLQELLGGELAIPSLGTLEQLDQVTPRSLYEAYTSMIKHDRIDVYVVGDVTRDQVTEAFLPLETLGSPLVREYPEPVDREFQRLEEQQDVKQSKLHLAYEANVDPRSEDAIKMQVVNGLFGGFPHSKLFMNVREKESLAYYAASQYSSLSRMLFVYAGIDALNQVKTEQIIADQLADLQAGEFDDMTLEQTKEMLFHQRRQLGDSPRQLIAWMSGSDIRPFSLEEEMAILARTTREDVAALSSQIKLKAIYCLKGGTA